MQIICFVRLYQKQVGRHSAPHSPPRHQKPVPARCKSFLHFVENLTLARQNIAIAAARLESIQCDYHLNMQVVCVCVPFMCAIPMNK